MRLLPILFVLTVLVAACGGGATVDTTPTTAPAPTTTTTDAPTTTIPAPSAVDWEDRSVHVTLADGWSVAYCEGDAPFLCVKNDGEDVGIVEILLRDALDYTAYDPAADDETNLRAIAAGFVEAFRADRSDGCGADYSLEAVDPRPVDLGETAGLVYGFRGTLADGSPSELHLQYAALSHGRLIVLAAGAYDADGCPGKDDMLSFDSAGLEEFAPHFEALLAASPLPGGDEDAGFSLPDGQNFVWVREDRGGVFLVDPARVLTGEEARLQAAADGVIPAGEDLPNDVYLWNPTGESLPVRFAADAGFTVIGSDTDGLTSQETDRETIAAILAGGDSGDVYGITSEFMPFDLVVVAGAVVEMNQVYLP